jgi:hypothetical protein
MATDQTVVEPVDSRSWLARWRRIITMSIVTILVSYLAAGFWAATLLADFPRFRLPDSFMFNSALQGLLAVALVHWAGNMFLSIEKDCRPIRWLRLLPHAIWFIFVPLLPVLAALTELGRGMDITTREMIPSAVPDVGLLAIVLCPLVTFFRLRKLAMQVGEVRLARQATVVAIGDVLSLLLMVGMQAWRFFNVQSFLGAVVFLLPQAVLMFFALASLYVLFEMAGHFFNLARPQRDKKQSWVGPVPIRS